MKKILLAIAMSSLLMAQTCGSTDLTQLIANAQKEAVAICNFLPTAETITQIFAKNNSSVQSGTAIAQAICAAVNAKSAGHVAGEAVVNAVVMGVPVKGYYVR